MPPPKEDKEFKKKVIDYVNEGKYARALKLLDDKVKDLLFEQEINKDLGTLY